MASSPAKRPVTPMRQHKQPDTVSPCPSASTSGHSVYDSSAPTTPPSGSSQRPDATIAERRGKHIGPLVDSMLLDHPIYGYTRTITSHDDGLFGVKLQDDCTPQAAVENAFEGDAVNYDKDAKTPTPAKVDLAGISPPTSPCGRSKSSVVIVSSTPCSETDLSRRGLPSACVFVANLAATRTDDELQRSLQAHFGKIGRLHVKIRRDEKGNPYSFCQFENDGDAKRAIREGRGAIIDGSGRRIRCEPARVNRTLLLSKIDNGIFDEGEARKALFGFGQLESLELISGKYAAARGIKNGCFVRFMYRQDAVDCHQYFRSNKTWSLEWANSGNQSVKTQTNPQNMNVDQFSIFVGQLNPDSITKEALQERFGKYGTILDCNLVIKPGKFGLGCNAFAFIKYDDHLSATRAIDQENNCPFLGKIIHVQRREFHDKTSRTTNQYENQYTVAANDGRQSTTPAISFSVHDVADLAARLTLNYAAQGNFNPRGPNLPVIARGNMNFTGDGLLQLPPGGTAQTPAVFLHPFYPQYFYGGPASAPAAPQSPRVMKEAQEHLAPNAGYYPQAEVGSNQPIIPNPELLHPHFNQIAHYDIPYGSYHVPGAQYPGLRQPAVSTGGQHYINNEDRYDSINETASSGPGQQA